MAFLEQYQNLSYHSLYKREINKLGINSLLVFNLDGIPFMARDYSDDNIKTSNDFIFLSAFISSLLKFIKVESNSYITDFCIATSRFYLKFDQFDHDQTIYCIVLSELLHRRITGEQLLMFVETVTHELKRIFNYYRSDSSGILKKDKFDEKFCLKIDRIFLELYDQHIAKAFAGQNGSEYLFDKNILIFQESTKNSLLDIGIKGLIICGLGGAKPIIMRNYEENLIESFDGAHFICSLSQTLNKFALTNFGFFTDVGLGHRRVLFKFKTENNITLCLIMTEIIFRRITGETLNMFSELMLARVHKVIQQSLTELEEMGVQNSSTTFEEFIKERIDSVLLDNAKVIYQELQT